MPTYDIGLEHVSLAFATKTIFTDVTQGVFEGDRIGIVGKNGDGKSTLLHLFRGTQEPDSGRVTKRGGLTFGILTSAIRSTTTPPFAKPHLKGAPTTNGRPTTPPREIVEVLLGGMSLDAKVGSLSGGSVAAPIWPGSCSRIGIFSRLTSPPTISTWSLSTGLPSI